MSGVSQWGAEASLGILQGLAQAASSDSTSVAWWSYAAVWLPSVACLVHIWWRSSTGKRNLAAKIWWSCLSAMPGLGPLFYVALSEPPEKHYQATETGGLPPGWQML